MTDTSITPHDLFTNLEEEKFMLIVFFLTRYGDPKIISIINGGIRLKQLQIEVDIENDETGERMRILPDFLIYTDDILYAVGCLGKYVDLLYAQDLVRILRDTYERKAEIYDINHKCIKITLEPFYDFITFRRT